MQGSRVIPVSRVYGKSRSSGWSGDDWDLTGTKALQGNGLCVHIANGGRIAVSRHEGCDRTGAIFRSTKISTLKETSTLPAPRFASGVKARTGDTDQIFGSGHPDAGIGLAWMNFRHRVDTVHSSERCFPRANRRTRPPASDRRVGGCGISPGRTISPSLRSSTTTATVSWQRNPGLGQGVTESAYRHQLSRPAELAQHLWSRTWTSSPGHIDFAVDPPHLPDGS